MSNSSETSSDEQTAPPQNVAAEKNANVSKKFKPNRSFREVALQRTLKTYIISNIVESYNVLAIRVLWKEENYSDMFTRRQVLISCVTAMEKGEELNTGLSFWMTFGWPDITANKFENMLCKKIMESGVKIDSCKGVKPRGASIDQIENLAASEFSASSIENNLPKKKVSKLRIVICNFQSIYNKNEELSNYLITNDIDILIGTETHLSCNILNSELIPKTGYQIVHRCDRNDGYGGVIIIAKESLITEPIKASNSHQIIAVKVETFQKPIIISSCYRSPNSSIQENNDLVQSINNLSKKFKSNPQFIGGDFNLPDVDWESYTITGSQYPRALNEQYLEAFDINSLSQAVNFPTRQKSILDLLITNRPSFIESCRPTPGFGDHQTAVLADVYCHPKRQRPVQRKIYLWNRANFDQMKQDVRQASDQFLENKTTDTPINNLWLKFKNIITTAQESNVPCKNSTKRYNQRWFNQSCRSAVRKKQRLYNRYKRTKQSADWNKYIKAAKKARLTCKQTCDKFINDNFLSEHKSNPKKFYSYIKSKKQDNIGITSLLSNGNTFTDDTQIAKILNNQFLSVFSEDDGRTPDIKGNTCPPISELEITQMVFKNYFQSSTPAKLMDQIKFPPEF
ncbi:uncharacterized protein [Clytia hemisphaerica]|uniref:uncharacterized protein n=1 Tax=Clytia hemisphaerica TaxID=252671 RepID=UPI0034D65529